MKILSSIQIQLAEQLLLSVKNKESCIEYNELAERINTPIYWRNVGKYIGEISILCHELGLPLLSAKVVNKNTKKAGEGFFSLYTALGMPTKGKTEKELFEEEHTAIRNCKKWYILEDYLGLDIGLDRPENMPKPQKKQVKELPPDIHRFSVYDPTPFHLSVEVINYGIGEKYTGKKYNGWQKGAFDFSSNGTSYMLWFPKVSMDGKPASSSGWINTIEDEGRKIIEKASENNSQIGYDVNDTIRLVFPKKGREPYLFAGVFLPDKELSTPRHHVYNRVAEIADFRGTTPIIFYNNEAVEDERLVSDLKAKPLEEVPTEFHYRSKPKEKAQQVGNSGHKVYPRDRQTSINALSHAKFCCEIDNSHPTFIRRNSDRPYTEPHHLVPMSFSNDFAFSLDVEENIVSLCSNCHNQIHYGKGAEKLIKKLYDERHDELKKVGINITLEELLRYYDREEYTSSK